MTVTTTLATLNALQAPVAHALAAAHGHHWTVLTAAQCVGLTSEQISDASIKACEPGIGCANDAPFFDEDGDVAHTTGSGRLSWRIDSEGFVTIEVHRPAPGRAPYDTNGVTVVYVKLAPQPWAEAVPEAPTAADWCWDTHGEASMPLPRHLAAAREAVRALVGLNPNAQGALNWLDTRQAQAEQAARWELREQLDLVRTDGQAQVAEAIELLTRRVQPGAFTPDGLATSDSLRAAEIRAQLLALVSELKELTGARHA